MSIERKNVMESIAKFQLHDKDENVIGINNSVTVPEIDEPVIAKAKEENVKKSALNILSIITPKRVMFFAVLCLIASTGYYVFKTNSVVGGLHLESQQTSQVTQDMTAFKADIAMMQATMNTVLERLDSVVSTEKMNQLKEKQVDDLIVKLTENNGEQDNYFGQELEKLTLWQKQYQKQQLKYLEDQKRQLANLEVDVEKLNKDAISHNYANKFTNWQSDVDTIKEQQIQINNLLLELQKEYIKLNQYQLHQKPVATQNMTSGN